MSYWESLKSVEVILKSPKVTLTREVYFKPAKSFAELFFCEKSMNYEIFHP